METPQDPATGSVHRELLLVVVNNPVAWKRKVVVFFSNTEMKQKVHTQIYLTTIISVSKRSNISTDEEALIIHTYTQNSILIINTFYLSNFIYTQLVLSQKEI